MRKYLLLCMLAALLLLSFPGQEARATEPLKVLVTLDMTTVAVGERIGGAWEASGGSGGYRYSYHWALFEEDGDETWLDNQWEVLDTSSSIAPLFGVSGKLYVEVVDDTGLRAYQEVPFTITGAVPTPKLTLNYSLSAKSVAVGQPITATWEAIGGTSPYTYSVDWYIGEIAGEEQPTNLGQYYTKITQHSITPKYGVSGMVSISVQDALGRRADASAPFTITGAQPVAPLVITPTLAKASAAINLNESLSGSWKATGGLEPYTYNYYWYVHEGDPERATFITSGYAVTQTSSSFLPRFGKGGRLDVAVTDARGLEAYASVAFSLSDTVEPPPLALSLRLDKDSVAVGQPITAIWETSGGTPPYLYRYTWDLLDANGNSEQSDGKWDVTSTTASYSTLHGERGRFTVEVTDSKGRWQYLDKEFAITGWQKTEPLALVLDLDKDEVAVGQPILGSWSVTGGSAPYIYQYDWSVMDSPEGRRYSVVSSSTEAKNNQFTPQHGAIGWLTVVVEDSIGQTLREEKEFTITGSAEFEPLKLSLSLDKAVADASKAEPLTADWSATGGEGAYHYDLTWNISELASTTGAQTVRRLDKTQLTTDTFPITYGAAGYVSVAVTDAGGRTDYAMAEFSITGSAAPVDPLMAAITLSNEQPRAGDSLTATVSPSGGTAPYTLAYEWIALPALATDPTVTFFTQPASDQRGSTVTLPDAGGKQLRVTVTDHEGRSIETGRWFTVLPAETGILRGDADNSGYLSIKDLEAIIDYLTDKSREPASLTNADANAKDAVTVDDALWLVNRLVN